MKKIVSMCVGSILLAAVSVGFADDSSSTDNSSGTTSTTATTTNGTNGTTTSSGNAKTDMGNHWICTTNASSSDVSSEKAADDQMAKNAGAADKSFAFAAQNCRDCTKITCEYDD